MVASCAPADQVFAEAWSPTLRAELGRSAPASEVAFARVADAFDDHRRRWTESYERACREPASRQRGARIGCLHGVRDRVALVSFALRTGRCTRCSIPTRCCRTSRPAPARHPWRRRRCPRPSPCAAGVFGLTAGALTLRTHTPATLPDSVATLEAAARTVEWAPLVPLILVTAGTEYLRHRDLASAREVLLRALPLAHAAGDARLEASARLGLLEASMHELEDPGMRAKKPDRLHDELARLVEYARSTIRAAGDDPVLAGELDSVRGASHRPARAVERGEERVRDALPLLAERTPPVRGRGRSAARRARRRHRGDDLPPPRRRARARRRDVRGAVRRRGARASEAAQRTRGRRDPRTRRVRARRLRRGAPALRSNRARSAASSAGRHTRAAYSTIRASRAAVRSSSRGPASCTAIRCGSTPMREPCAARSSSPRPTARSSSTPPRAPRSSRATAIGARSRSRSRSRSRCGSARASAIAGSVDATGTSSARACSRVTPPVQPRGSSDRRSRRT